MCTIRYLYTQVVMREGEDAEEEQSFVRYHPEPAYIADIRCSSF